MKDFKDGTLKPFQGKIMFGDKTSNLQITHTGTLMHKWKDAGGRLIKIEITDAFYVPGLKMRLLSVSKLMEKNVECNFWWKQIYLSDRWTTIPMTTQGNIFAVENHFV